MSNKTVLKFVVALGLLVVVLLFLGANFVPGISALSSTKGNAVKSPVYAGSDYFERHPSTVSRMEELRRIKDEGMLMDTRLSGPSRLEELARIKEDVFSADTRLSGPSRLEELARIKDQVFPTETRLNGPSRLEELARIKER